MQVTAVLSLRDGYELGRIQERVFQGYEGYFRPKKCLKTGGKGEIWQEGPRGLVQAVTIQERTVEKKLVVEGRRIGWL